MKPIKILLTVFVTGVCALSAHGQKQLQYVPQALKGAKMVPYVIHPNLSPAVRTHFALPVVRPQVTAGVERQVTHTTVQAQLALQFPQPKDFMTGPQALQTLRPGWKSELMLSGFTRQQLALVEQTFKETDQFLFETDEESSWLKPRFAEWNYMARYTKILTDNAYGELAFNDGQLKTLFGKFSRLDDVFTRLNYQAFLLVHQRAPKAGAPAEEGVLARKAKYNLDKRDGRKMNPEVESYIYGRMPGKLLTLKPSYGPKNRVPRHTPQEVLEQVETFVTVHDGHFPSRNAEDLAEKSLRRAFDTACSKAEGQLLQDDTSRRLLALKDKHVNKYTAERTPQEVYGEIVQFIKEQGRFPSQYAADPAEKSLRKALDNACRKAQGQLLQDDANRRLLALKEKYVRGILRPQDVLGQVETFVKEHDGRFPSQYAKDPAEKSLRKAFDKACYKAEGQLLQDDTSRHLLALKDKHVNKIAVPRTSQEVLEQVKMFGKEHDGRFPSRYAEDPAEKSLRQAFDTACRKINAQHLTDETSLKLLALKKEYVKVRHE